MSLYRKYLRKKIVVQMKEDWRATGVLDDYNEKDIILSSFTVQRISHQSGEQNEEQDHSTPDNDSRNTLLIPCENIIWLRFEEQSFKQ